MLDGERDHVGESVSVNILDPTVSAEGSYSGSMDEQKGEWGLKVGFGVLTAVIVDSTILYVL
jgi:hypothetical protein